MVGTGAAARTSPPSSRRMEISSPSTGRTSRGEEIAPFHQELFDKWLKGSHLVGKVKDVRFLSPDVAVMHAVGSTVMRGKDEPSPERDSIQTLLAIRQDGEWRLAAFQNTRVRPVHNVAAFSCGRFRICCGKRSD